MKFYLNIPIKKKTKIYISIIAVTFLVSQGCSYYQKYKSSKKILDSGGAVSLLPKKMFLYYQKYFDEDEVTVLAFPNKLSPGQKETKLFDLGLVRNLPRLDAILMNGKKDFIDLNLLVSKKGLIYVELSNFKQKDINKVLTVANPSLKLLGIRNCKQGYIYFSEGLNIEVLSIYNCDVKGITGIEKLTHLKELDISGLGITDISFLENCPNLEVLNIDGSNMKDFNVLKKLKKLRKLSFSTDGDISFLKDLTTLKELNVWYNSKTFKIDDYSKEYEKRKMMAKQLKEIQKALPNCQIISDHYSNVWDIR